MGAGLSARKSFLAYLLRAPLLSVGTNELADKAGTISNVIVLIIFRQVQYILCQQFSLKDRKERKTQRNLILRSLKSFMPDRQCTCVHLNNMTCRQR